MKKLLSIILVGILAVSSFILTTFATENEKSETEIEREKLGWLLDAFKILNTNIGEARIYNCVAGDTYNDAYNLYNQENRRKGQFRDDEEPVAEDYSDLEIDESADGDEFIFYNGKMMKRSYLLKLKKEAEERKNAK